MKTISALRAFINKSEKHSILFCIALVTVLELVFWLSGYDKPGWNDLIRIPVSGIILGSVTFTINKFGEKNQSLNSGKTKARTKK